MRIRPLGFATMALLLACSGGESSDLPRLVKLETGQYAHDDPTISPDGRFIAFTARVRGNDGVYVADADGGNARLVSQLALDVNDPSWSPDSRNLVYVASEAGGGELYRVSIDSGSPVQLTRVAAEEIGEPLFSPDGSRILFVSDHSGRLSLWIIAADGGEPVEVLPGESGDIYHGRWSPDGTRIAMNLGAESGRIVAVVDLATGAVTRVTNEGVEEFQEWSPDGTTLTYVSVRTGAEDIFIVPAEGGEAQQLTVDVRDDFQPVYSPDGRWIAYVSDRGGQRDIWVVPSEGGEARRVTNDRAPGGWIQWTPDSKEILFVRLESPQSLYAVETNGGSLRQITRDTVNSSSPSISPDGRTVVYSSQRGGVTEIFLVPIEGGQERALVTGSNSTQPAWSPDGSMIAFASRRGPLLSVWAKSVESGEEWQVSPDGVEAFTTVWSPDGSRIGYGVRDPSGAVSLLVAPTRGGDATRVLDRVPLLASAAWSPDGRSFLFHRPVPGNDRFGVFRVPATGGQAVALTTGQPVHDIGPRWSSDGTRVAYTVNSQDGGADVWIMNADGSGKQRLTSGPELERALAWAADDTEIYFLNGLFGISAVSVATGAIRQVFDGEIRLRDVSFSKDRSMLVVQGAPEAIYLMRADLHDLLAREP